MYDLQQKAESFDKISQNILQEMQKGGADFEYNRFCTIFNHRTWYTRHNLFCIEENENASEFYTAGGD